MKLKKPKFSLGTFGFGQRGNSQISDTQMSLPTYVQVVSKRTAKKDNPKTIFSSTFSLTGHYDSWENKRQSSTTPVLLAVKKRASSETGINEGPNFGLHSLPIVDNTYLNLEEKSVIKKQIKTEGNSRLSSGFFRIFIGKSATHTFEHLKSESNPEKSYKENFSRRIKENHISKKESERSKLISNSLSLAFGTSSSRSSFISYSIVRNKQAYSGSSEDSGGPSGVFRGSTHTKKKESSANSVISLSSSRKEFEDCDSGAFSRASSPVHFYGLRVSSSSPALLNNSSSSLNRLFPSEPLVAPSLVLAACLEYGVPIVHDTDVLDFISTKKNESSQDVTITVGATTKLTITPELINKRSVYSTSINRDLLFCKPSELPSSQSFSSYSIPSLNFPSFQKFPLLHPQSRSVIEISTSSWPRVRTCCCTNLVTINGKHHCYEAIFDSPQSESEDLLEVKTQSDTQPNSIIQI